MLTVYDQEKAALSAFWRDADPQTREPSENSQQALGPLGNFIRMLILHIYDMKAFAHNVPHFF